MMRAAVERARQVQAVTAALAQIQNARGADIVPLPAPRVRRFLAATILISLMVSCTHQIEVGYPYRVANYIPALDSSSAVLREFPLEGKPLTVHLPVCLGLTLFGPDGRSLYGTNATPLTYESLGLSKIEFNPIRASMVPGTSTFGIKSFAVSIREDKLIIAGARPGSKGWSCGVFEILLPAGEVRQVLTYDCSYRWSWDHLSLSPTGKEAVATVGSNTDHDLHLELIDLVHGTTKSLVSGSWVGVWSPDGKWIAILEGRSPHIFLIDPRNPSQRRSLGHTSSIRPEWSPDSRYLLL